MMTLKSPELESTAESADKNRRRPSLARPSAALCSLLIFAIINMLITSPSSPRRQELTKSAVRSSHYEAMLEGPWPWWIARAVLLNSRADVALMGDSQINAAVFQADAFALGRPIDCTIDRQAPALTQMLSTDRRTPPKVINLAMGGAVASDQYLIGKALFTQVPPKMVMVGISPRCFLDNSLSSASATDPFQFFEPHVDLGPLSHLAYPDFFSESARYLKDVIPMLALHDRFLDWFSSQVRGYQPDSPALRLSAANRSNATPPAMLRGIYGCANDVKKGEIFVTPTVISDFYDNTAEYLHRFKDLSVPAYKVQQRFFEAFLDNLHQLGIQTVVVGMPCTAAHRRLLPKQFWSQYREWLAHQCTSHEAVWLDLSEDPSFTQKHFLDNVHVNAFGAKLLMQKLASLLMTNPTLRANLETAQHEAKALAPEFAVSSSKAKYSQGLK